MGLLRMGLRLGPKAPTDPSHGKGMNSNLRLLERHWPARLQIDFNILPQACPPIRRGIACSKQSRIAVTG